MGAVQRKKLARGRSTAAIRNSNKTKKRMRVEEGGGAVLRGD